MLAFPMPNDRLSNANNIANTVIASVWYTDEIATVLLLRQMPPFFVVAHYYMSDVPAEYEVEPRQAGHLHLIQTNFNIVPAVEAYVENGGEY